ncbi:MAG: hypothetical protein HC888_04765 [Candidatus Competibacteraceae bacterium]|nr:hypothetical protein [Candidatus Competibacteraceae bacterium]
MKKIEALLIDPQIDFCHPDGSLYVNGADQDMKRLAAFIKKNVRIFADINVTLDSHHLVDVAHPIFWRDSAGNNPQPFTIISAKDIQDGVWQPRIPSMHARMLDYVRNLESSGRYPLCIWPPHCLIGSGGHNVVPELFDALTTWERERFGMVNYVTKGSNIYTEHYSAIKAEVPDPNDPTTQLNTDLINKLLTADEILVAGEAGSHCVANTALDICEAFGTDEYIKKIVLLTDAMSPVTGYENNQDEFLDKIVSRGAKLTTTRDYAP